MKKERIVPVSDELSEDYDRESQETSSTYDDMKETRTLPRRKATIAARLKIKDWLNPKENILIGGVSRIARDDVRHE